MSDNENNEVENDGLPSNEELSDQGISPLQKPLPDMPRATDDQPEGSATTTEATPGLENATSVEDEALSEGDVA